MRSEKNDSGLRRRSTDSGIETETLVVTSEQGVVLTGSRSEAFEARILASVRKPLIALGGLLFIMFVAIVGVTILVDDLKDVVSNTDKLVTEATGDEGKAQQATAIASLLAEMNCQDQRNLQRAIIALGVSASDDSSQIEAIVEPKCQKVGP